MLLELSGIEKSFERKHVLKGISFTASSGSAFGLLGRNGAGKTTTLRILMNVFPADSGTLTIDGKPIDYEKVRFGYLPEERGLYPKRKVKEQLVYFARLKGLSRTEASQSVDYWLGRLGMEGESGKRLETLSKGNQQKIQLVTALAHDPDIIALDEPFSGLDPVNASMLKEIVSELIRSGKLVIFSSHQMNYVEEFCDRIAIIEDGSISLCGDLYQIKRSYTRDKLLIRTAEAEKMLGTLGGRCRRVGSHELIYTLEKPDKKKEQMGYLVKQFDIDEIGVYEPSMNDIFIQYAGGNGAEPEKEGGHEGL